MVPYKGSVEALVHQLTGGIRSGMGLAGCPTIEDLRTKSRMIRITSAGLKESHAHDVIITKEAPNYTRRKSMRRRRSLRSPAASRDPPLRTERLNPFPRRTSQSFSRWSLPAVVALGVIVRLLFLFCTDPRAISVDLQGWVRVWHELEAGRNPYVTTTLLNWPPLWMAILGLLGKVSTGSGFPSFA